MWMYNDNPFTDDMISDNVGFVYVIKNVTNGKKYIGKKLFTKSKSYQKNNVKKRKRVSSNWSEYTGSNNKLNEDISNGHIVTKEIIHLCKSKGWLSFWETREILVNNAIIDNNYYNDWVSCKIRRSHLK